MSNPIKHVRETGEYVSIKPKPAVMGYRADDPIPSNNETLLYWKKAFECKVRENTRLKSELDDLEWDITFLKDQLRQKEEYITFLREK